MVVCYVYGLNPSGFPEGRDLLVGVGTFLGILSGTRLYDDCVTLGGEGEARSDSMHLINAGFYISIDFDRYIFGSGSPWIVI